MKSRQQLWLESLPPDVRADAEADIAMYDNPDIEEETDYNEDWSPAENLTMSLSVPFNREEIRVISEAFGASAEMFEIMHDGLMERAREIIAERGESERDSVAAD